MKTFVLILSEKFPSSHPRSGEETGFLVSLKDQLKKHTIRGNYELWKNRIDQVNNGEAVLSIRKWGGKPYRSKQVEILQLTHLAEIDVARLNAYGEGFEVEHSDGIWKIVPDNVIAKNDGLKYQDFKDWFDGYKMKDMALIYLSAFRY